MSPLLWVLVLFAFWAALYLAYRRFKESMSGAGLLVYPLFLMWRHRSRGEWAPSLAKSAVFRVYEVTSVAVTGASMGIGVYLIVSIASAAFLPSSVPQAKLEPLIPGVTVGLLQVPYMLVAVAISITLHEIMHALSSTSQGIEVRRIGIVLIGVFPGAFVEPDQSQFSPSRISSKLKVISAGVAFNAFLAALSYLLILLAVSSLSQGLLVQGVVAGSPAQIAGIRSGEVIEAINGTHVTSASQVAHYTAYGTPLNLTLMRSGEPISILVTPRDGKIGVYLSYFVPSPLGQGVIDFLSWVFVVNFSLSAFNGAPLVITDGGKFLTELMMSLGPGGERVAYSIQMAVLLLFLIALGFSL